MGRDAAGRTHGPAAGWRLVFEARDPAAKAWLECNRQRSYRSAVVAGVGAVQAWEDVFDVSGGLVSFRSTFVFESDGAVLTSQSTSSSSSPDAPAMPPPRRDLPAR
jgi:hypothetical protein